MLGIRSVTNKFILVLILFFAVADARALEINSYSATTDNRFSSGYPSNPVSNSSFWGSGYDWSGVGWNHSDSTQSIALISNNYFVGAHHYYIPVGNYIDFFNRDGTIKTFQVDSYQIIPPVDGQTPDLLLGKLTAPVQPSDKISYYAVVDAASSWYLDKELEVYGRTAIAGKNTVDSYATVKTTGSENETFCVRYDFDTTLPAGDAGQAGLQGGDSGSPLFMVYNGSLTLLGTHFAISTVGNIRRNYDSFVPYYIDDLNSLMSGSGDSVTVVPEPSAAAFIIIGVLGLIPGVCRRRKSA